MNEHIKVTTVQHDTERFAASLTISEQRETEIDQIIEECTNTTKIYPDAIAAVSERLENANELAYACFHMGAWAQAQRAKHNLLQKILGD